MPRFDSSLGEMDWGSNVQQAAVGSHSTDDQLDEAFGAISGKMPAAQRSEFMKGFKEMPTQDKRDLLSGKMTTDQMVSRIAKKSGRSEDQVRGYLNNNYSMMGYPGYPGGLSALQKDIKGAGARMPDAPQAPAAAPQVVPQPSRPPPEMTRPGPYIASPSTRPSHQRWDPDSLYNYSGSGESINKLEGYVNADYQPELAPGNRQSYTGDLGRASEWGDGERLFKPGSAGESKWITDQLERSQRQGKSFVEIDNVDNKSDAQVQRMYQAASDRSMQVIMKNPSADQIKKFGAMKDKNGDWTVVGATFEKGAMMPNEFGAARGAAGRLDLQGRFVRHGGSKDSVTEDQARRELTTQTERTPGTSSHWAETEYHNDKVIARNPKAGEDAPKPAAPPQTLSPAPTAPQAPSTFEGSTPAAPPSRSRMWGVPRQTGRTPEDSAAPRHDDPSPVPAPQAAPPASGLEGGSTPAPSPSRSHMWGVEKDLGPRTEGLDRAMHELRQHRSDMEKPIRESVDAPMPHLKRRGDEIAKRQKQRVDHEDKMRASRERHTGSTGFN